MLACAVKRLKTEAPELVAGERLPVAVWLRPGLKSVLTVGYSEPSCARTFATAERRLASAASRLGFAAIASAITLLSGRLWKSLHQSCGISVAGTNRCFSPSA